MAGSVHRAHIFLLLFTAFFLISQLLNAQARIPPQLLSDKRLIKDFIEEEMVYPTEALEAKIEGEVEIGCVVDDSGNVSDITIKRSVSPEVDAEAIRIFRKLLWKPGTVLGIPEAMDHSYVIKFDAGKYKKYCKKRGYEEIKYPHEPVDGSYKVYETDECDISPRPVFSSLNCTLEQFVANNLKYPDAAFKQNISGTVEIRFVVEPSGRISNIHAIKSLGGGCTEEAIRLARLINWNPGIKDKQAVRVFNTLNITFNIAGRSVNGSPAAPGQVH